MRSPAGGSLCPASSTCPILRSALLSHAEPREGSGEAHIRGHGLKTGSATQIILASSKALRAVRSGLLITARGGLLITADAAAMLSPGAGRGLGASGRKCCGQPSPRMRPASSSRGRPRARPDPRHRFTDVRSEGHPSNDGGLLRTTCTFGYIVGSKRAISRTERAPGSENWATATGRRFPVCDVPLANRFRGRKSENPAGGSGVFKQDGRWGAGGDWWRPSCLSNV